MSDACITGCIVPGRLAYADPTRGRDSLHSYGISSRPGIYVKNMQRDAINTILRSTPTQYLRRTCTVGRELSRLRKFSVSPVKAEEGASTSTLGRRLILFSSCHPPFRFLRQMYTRTSGSSGGEISRGGSSNQAEHRMQTTSRPRDGLSTTISKVRNNAC
ncbi:hypothetical protein B0H11DRAFT_1899507 [Mycena galericulata]|nr:hypothetical protein B0H11DRAFT_1899507 [Mycena galericulata]